MNSLTVETGRVPMYVYLAGPISGLTKGESIEWRNYVEQQLEETDDIITFSPMRWKDGLPDGILDKNVCLGEGVEDEMCYVLASAAGIVGRDNWDVDRCDVLFAYLADTQSVSIGTVCEIARKAARQEPIVAVLDERHTHPFITQAVTHLCPNLEVAIEVLKALQ